MKNRKLTPFQIMSVGYSSLIIGWVAMVVLPHSAVCGEVAGGAGPGTAGVMAILAALWTFAFTAIGYFTQPPRPNVTSDSHGLRALLFGILSGGIVYFLVGLVSLRCWTF